MSLIDKITSDLKEAMKKRDQSAVEALRLIKSEIGYKKIDKGDELDDKELAALLSSIENKWKDGIDQFKKGNRPDLVEQETAKFEVLQRYLPKKLTGEELNNIINEVIEEIGASSKADFGKAMKAVMERVRGVADGVRVKEIISSKLT